MQYFNFFLCQDITFKHPLSSSCAFFRNNKFQLLDLQQGLCDAIHIAINVNWTKVDREMAYQLRPQSFHQLFMKEIERIVKLRVGAVTSRKAIAVAIKNHFLLIKSCSASLGFVIYSPWKCMLDFARSTGYAMEFFSVICMKTHFTALTNKFSTNHATRADPLFRFSVQH